MPGTDTQLTCGNCGDEFTFTAAEQDFYHQLGYSTPKRCKTCREARKLEMRSNTHRIPAEGYPVVCSECHRDTSLPFEPTGSRPVFCRECFLARKNGGPLLKAS